MSWFDRIANLLRRNDLGSDIDEEIQFHIDARTRDNIHAGMPDDRARHDARRRFGNRTLAKERTRDMDLMASIETVGQDLRYAWRSLRKSPGFAALAILALALGIGANTAVFTVVNGVLLRPLSFDQPGQLFLISYKPQSGPVGSGRGLVDRHYLEFQQRTRAFEQVATFTQESVALTGGGEAVRSPAARVTSSFFPVLGAKPIRGRTFTTGDDARAALLGESLWRSRFGSDPNIVGKPIVIDGVERTVIGVMPAGFAFPAHAELWLPLTVKVDPRNSYFRPCVGRLRPGVLERQARAELETLAATFPIEPGENRSAMTAEILPLEDLLVGGVRKSLLVFMGAVTFVLLIACANVANLVLMRGSLRRQEMGVRAALGASRGRLVRQLLTESTLLSLAGALAGIGLASFGVRALLALAPAGRVPRIEEIRIDTWVLMFALGLGALTGILLGLLPAIQATGRELRASLGQLGRSVTGRRETLRSGLVISEIALTLVLLTGAGLLLKSFLRMREVDPGFRPENILTMTVDLPESTYQTAPGLQAFHTATLEKLSRLPGVLAVGAVNWLPLAGALIQGDFHVERGGGMPQGYVVDKVAVSPAYFQVMGMRLSSGRGFGEHDNSGAPGVAIISESVGRAVWPGGDALGKRISLVDDPKPEDWLTIVGIVADVRQESLTAKAHPAIYRPYTQVRHPFFLAHMTFAVRTAAGPESLAPAIRAVLREVDRNQPPQSITAMADLVAATTAEPRFQARLISIFSILALVLAAIGVYGVLASAVAERTREIGIRMALGADKKEITRMVLNRSLLLVAVGVLLGTIGALAVTRVLATFLFEIKPTDPATFASGAALLVAVALLAGWMPARRATSVDPVGALRCE